MRCVVRTSAANSTPLAASGRVKIWSSNVHALLEICKLTALLFHMKLGDVGFLLTM